MKNIEDLYKESGMKPADASNGDAAKGKDDQILRNNTSLFISFLAATILVAAGLMLFNDGSGHNPKKLTAVGILILPLDYLFNYLFNLIRKRYSKSNN